MTNQERVWEAQDFAQQMRDCGECRIVTTRYTDKGMVVTIVLAEAGMLPESYMFEWVDND